MPFLTVLKMSAVKDVVFFSIELGYIMGSTHLIQIQKCWSKANIHLLN